MCDSLSRGILLSLYAIVKSCKPNTGPLEGSLKAADVLLLSLTSILTGSNPSTLLMLNRKAKLLEIKRALGPEKKAESREIQLRVMPWSNRPASGRKWTQVELA